VRYGGDHAERLAAPAAGTSNELFVTDSVVTDTVVGIVAAPSGSSGLKVTLDRVRVENSTTGISFQGTSTTGSVRGTVRDSLVAGCTTGISVSENGSGITTMMIDRTASVHNTTGIRASGSGATIRIGDSTVSENTSGLSNSSGKIESYRTNKVNGNTTDVSGTITPVAMK
jgi:hypothetical protein